MKRILTLSFLFLFAVISGYAADQVVVNNNDSGDGSLRQAIADVDDGEKITFNLAAGNEIITILSELAIAKSLTIDGANTAGSGVQVTVKVTTPGPDGSAYRVFNITAGTVNINNLVMQGGAPADGSGGGVILTSGTSTNISLDGVTVEQGDATEFFAGGGGIYFTGTCTIKNSLIQDNISNNEFYAGGGVCQAENAGALEVTNTTFKNNQAIGGIGPVGGAIIFSPTGTTNTISGCTFENNHADAEGGAIYIDGATLNVENTTFYGNSSNADGGVIYIRHTGGNQTTNVTFNSVSIVNNTATGTGAGVHLNSGILTVQNSILANNESKDFFNGTGTLTDNGYNIVEFQNGSDFAGSPNNNHLGDQPNLFGTGIATQTLANNGGPTQTLAIVDDGSVAHEAGSTALTTDQRGATRSDPPTIGAFEFSQLTWTGTSDQEWDNVANWSGNSLPTATDDVIIPQGITNYPIIRDGVTATCANMIVEDGTPIGLLNVSGNLTVNGEIGVFGIIGVTGANANLQAGTVFIPGGNITVGNSGQANFENLSLQSDGNLFIETNGIVTVNPINVTLTGTSFINMNNGSLNVPVGDITVGSGCSIDLINGSNLTQGTTP